MPAGKMVPLVAFGLLREDSVRAGRMSISLESMETAEILMNGIIANVKAYFVPHLAFDRFNGADQLNRAYEGIPDKPGDPVIPYIETEAYGAQKSNQILWYLGKHAKPTDLVSTGYTEAYNQIWNMRARNRSLDIPLRTRLQKDLAPAFWQHGQFEHIKADFDQAVIDGEVALNVVNSRLPVKGIGIAANAPTSIANVAVRETGGAAYTNYPHAQQTSVGGMLIKRTADTMANGSTADVWAELQSDGITVSLSNIELAKRTQAFARLREQYSGHSDEYIINLLMDGISIPDQAWQQPILLADKSVPFGMAKRYASDGANLTESVVNGSTGVDLSIVLPRCPYGGVVMVVAEVLPEQLFERQQDPYLHTTSVANLPQFLRDTLDPEKVEVVRNGYIDVAHATPNGAFGYAPLNHKWNQLGPAIGGKFFRWDPTEGFKEDRQRMWLVESVNPSLSADFMIANAMHTKPFVVTNADPFEALVQGEVAIDGNTVFGGVLVEAMENYTKVMAEAPLDRIEKA